MRPSLDTPNRRRAPRTNAANRYETCAREGSLALVKRRQRPLSESSQFASLK
jgi:hypothetical protein